MKLGLSMNSVYAVDEPREAAGWMVERARAAQAAGLDALFLGDHHVTPIPYFQNVPTLGRLLAEWRGPVSGALFLLPLWHPVLLAEQIGTLAALAPGEFVVQCALGAEGAQFSGMGVSARERRSRFEQGLGLLRRLLDGEVVDHDGHWTLAGARVSPRPAQRPAFWIGASAPAAIDRAARLGDGWIAGPELSLESARRQLAWYRERCAFHGRAPGVAVLRRDVYVGASADEALATGGPVVAAGHRGFPPDATLVGDVAQVGDGLAGFAALGFEWALVRNLVREPRAALACVERLRDVREGLRER